MQRQRQVAYLAQSACWQSPVSLTS
jgi:hypothetical protein